MHTVEQLFADFGGPSQVGQAIGVSTEHAAAMKRRNSIPVGYWPDLIEAAHVRAIPGFTYEALALMHTNRARAESAA